MIRRFSLKNFRNYERADLDFAPARNLFIGGNGQGKSNLLEAIFYLAILRSFRTGKISELVQIGRREFCLEAELIDGRKRDLFRSEYNCENRRTLCINGERISKSSEFIGEITPIVFAPEDIRIISGPSSQRRSFLDMFISMEQAGYMRSLYCYTQALKQRNAVLRKHLPRASAEVFGAVMARYGIEIAHARMAAISELEQEMLRLFEKYPLIQREFKLNYQFDYQLDFESYNRTLNDNYLREIKRGFTTLGPHLDEMVCLYDRKLARNFASAGQTRLLALFFKIARYFLRRSARRRKHSLRLLKCRMRSVLPIRQYSIFATAGLLRRKIKWLMRNNCDSVRHQHIKVMLENCGTQQLFKAIFPPASRYEIGNLDDFVVNFSKSVNPGFDFCRMWINLF